MKFPGTQEEFTPELRRAYYAECRAQTVRLTEMGSVNFPPSYSRPLRAWRSRTHLVGLWQQGEHQRLTMQRTAIKNGQWQDGMTWDEMMRLKAEAGFGDRWAVEIFPPSYAWTSNTPP